MSVDYTAAAVTLEELKTAEDIGVRRALLKKLLRQAPGLRFGFMSSHYPATRATLATDLKAIDAVSRGSTKRARWYVDEASAETYYQDMKYDVEDKSIADEMAMRLSLNETRQAAVKQIVELYDKTRTLASTAEALGIGSSTLDKFIARTPDLRKALDVTRKAFR